jgi:hypothetical protein
MTSQPSESVEVDNLSFVVRAQKFKIVATVMKRTTVPLVTEYATRLVHLVKGITPEELAAFFEFEPAETRVLLQDVLSSGLVDERDGQLVLSQQGYQSLSPMDDSLDLFDIEEIITTICLDLIAFAPVEDADLDAREARIVEEVPIPNRPKAALASSVAHEAFQTHFHEWRQMQRRRRGLDEDTRLHAIEDIQVVKSFAAPVEVPVRCRLVDVPGVEPDFSDLANKGRAGSRNALIQALSTKIKSIAAARDHMSAYDFVSDLDQGIFRRNGVKSSSEQGVWAALASDADRQFFTGPMGPGLRLVGSAATESVRSALLDWTEGIAGIATSRTPVFWLPPNLPHWGRTIRFASLASALSEANAAEDGTVLLARVDSGPNAARPWERLYGRTQRLEPLFDRCLAVPRVDVPDALELVVKPGAWALALIHAPDPQTGYPCPFGYIVGEPSIVAKYTYRIAEVASRAEGTKGVIWHQADENAHAALAMIDQALGIGVA